MSITIRGPSDDALLLFQEVFQAYQEQCPAAEIGLYRLNSVSIRIRIIDPAFDGMDKSARHARIWGYLEKLPEDVQSDISMIVLLTPGEAGRSLANLGFEHPSSSLL